MKVCQDYYVTVIEDTRKGEIIAAASLIVERKFIHHCAMVRNNEVINARSNWIIKKVDLLQRGRLEDVVVNDTYRGKQLGKL